MRRPPDDNRDFPTLVDVLRARAQRLGELPLYTFLVDGDSQAQVLSYAELDRRAQRVGGLLERISAAGERAILVHPPGLDYIVSLFGCLYAGVIAVPVYPPRPNRPDPRLKAIVADSGATVALTVTSVYSRLDKCFLNTPELKALRWVNTDELSDDKASPWQPPAGAGDALAVMQYTSGSTGTPKGVMLSHANLLHNLGVIHDAFELHNYRRGVSWLPPYHDMGLIGGILEVMFGGGSTVLMSPAAFIQKPLRWLQAISRTQAHISGGPNFAYDLCVRTIPPEERKKLDLSSWSVAFTGAEPISADTLDRFAEAFAVAGFRRESYYPCYGMAESTLMVTGSVRGTEPLYQAVERAPLEHHQVVMARRGDDGSKTLVGCGHAVGEQRVLVVHPDSRLPCGPRQVGEIWVSGGSVAQGYWNRPEETARTFGGRLAEDDGRRYLRTGDLGFMVDEELYVCGRLSDLIILRGRNYYPQDIERAVDECHPALRPGCGAAFVVEAEGEQRLVVLHEVDRGNRDADLDELIATVRERVAEQCELQVDAVVLLKTASIPKTSSGKIQRGECRRRFLAGELESLAVWERAREQAVAPPTAAPTQASVQTAADAVTAEDIQSWMVTRIASHLNVRAADIDITAHFARYGLDSVTLVGISGELEQWLGRELSPTLLYNEPTVEALARKLAETVAPLPAAPQRTVAARPQAEPIAVIGLGCRLPGAESPAAFWQLLRDGRHAIGPLPEDRTRLLPEGVATPQGGFLRDVDKFDAQFFGIAPSEAVSIDPQHRLLLQVAWEAMEDAGVSPTRFAGTPVGVFVGISNADYARLLARDPSAVTPYYGTGSAMSMAAHRLSYHFDFRGPSLSVDTACSSSLVAIHLACQNLRSGDCQMALAAGVNLILSPELSTAFAQAQMLSPTGRCHTFDAAADGYVRGEGCGVIVLKRLSDALAAGDRVLAVIRGSAVNQDGRSNGITAPNGSAQEALIREALRNAGVAASQISYVEAHGTGTVLGDPIEFNALKAALTDEGKPGLPCAVGSVKTNVGHLEAAAGVAAVIKTVLALQHGEIPPHLHLERLNPHIGLEGTRFQIPTQRRAWDSGALRRRAGVSSFGFGGTNAHLVLEEAPLAPVRTAAVERPRHILALSARSPAALRDQARRHDALLAEQLSGEAAHLCHTAAACRSHFQHRLAIVGSSVSDFRDRLRDFLAGQTRDGIHTGKAPSSCRPKVAMLFTGQGAQYVGMGRQLYETSPAFRRTFDRCDEILRGTLERPLAAILDPHSPAAAAVGQTGYTQPAMFALEYALAETVRGWGVEPAAVIGHSLGEYVAACVAGVFSLEDGLRLVAERGRLMQQLPLTGEMAAVFAPLETVVPALGSSQGQVEVAAINGPQNVVLSGPRDALRSVLKTLENAGHVVRPLVVSHAFHSRLMEPMLDAFERFAGQLAYSRPRIPLVSNLTGMLVDAEVPGPGYWRRHVREPVWFARGMQTLFEHGCDVFLEIGPHPTLIALGQACRSQAEGLWLPALRRGQGDWDVLAGSVAALYAHGVEVDWEGFDRDYSRRRVSLPTYPFEQRSYWIKSAAPRETISTPAARSTRFNGTVANGHEASHANGNGHGKGQSHENGNGNGHASGHRNGNGRGNGHANGNGHGKRRGRPAVSPRALAADLRPLAQRLFDEHGLARLPALERQLDSLIADFARSALRQLGWRPAPADRVTRDELAGRLAVEPRHRRLLGRILDMLAEDGDLRRLGEGSFEVIALGSPTDFEARLAELTAAHPQCAAELALAARCGAAWADVLCGRQDALSVLFPEGSAELVEALYESSPVARHSNALVAEAVAAALKRLPQDRKLRILEIGAGTGGTTSHVLRRLPADRVEYVFTDVTPLFTARAAEKFADRSGLEFAVLDIERDPIEQGFPHHGFDLVLAANVLHATANLRVSLESVRLLLASEGLLVLLEGTRPQRLLDLIFGLTEGWWRFEDVGLRPAHALISREKWCEVLEDLEFAEPVGVPEEPADAQADSPQLVLLARGPRVSASAEHAAPSAALRGAPRGVETPRVDDAIRRRILAAPPGERSAILERYLREQVCGILGLELEQLDLDAPVTGLGLDSLMAIQLKNRIEGALGVSVPMVAFLKGITVRELLHRALEQMSAGPAPVTTAPAEPAAAANGAHPGNGHASAPPAAPIPAPVADLLARVDQFSEAELDSVLRKLMADGPGL
jgi:acyl transferase domain-containing protein/acyl-CoA synthetase (AMP-forming)/AMP-acid ligase II/acyl carrier protein/SAM-dependent methyltransferase